VLLAFDPGDALTRRPELARALLDVVVSATICIGFTTGTSVGSPHSTRYSNDASKSLNLLNSSKGSKESNALSRMKGWDGAG